MRNFLSVLFPLLILLIGVPLMIGTSGLITSPQVATLMLLVVFIVYNIISARYLGLWQRLKNVWAPQKLWHIFAGFLIGLIPIGTAYTYYYFRGELAPFQGMTVLMAILTLVTVSWEELWFRGVALEFGANKYSKIGAVVIFAVVFALLHAMNPKIILFEDGLQLFIAGYALGVCYFAFNSIWAPIGMHFANNFVQALFGKSTEPRSLIYLVPLIIIGTILTTVVWRRQESAKVLN